MNEFYMQGLAYIIDVSKGVTPKSITAEHIEANVASLVGQALTMMNPDSSEFETVVKGLGVETYCSLTVFRLVYELAMQFKENNTEAASELLREVIKLEIPGKIFRKFIHRFYIDIILNYGLLSDYRDFVYTALDVIKDPEVEDVSLFRLSNYN